MAETCHDCGVKEGHRHNFGCDMECCPFCGRQLISCDCSYRTLELRDTEKWSADTAFLPPETYENGLTVSQEKLWRYCLAGKGRIPYIIYPSMCSKCGTLWPDMFDVPDEEWEYYIQPNMRDTMLCRSCYDLIKELIDRETTIYHYSIAKEKHIGPKRRCKPCMAELEERRKKGGVA